MPQGYPAALAKAESRKIVHIAVRHGGKAAGVFALYAGGIDPSGDLPAGSLARLDDFPHRIGRVFKAEGARALRQSGQANKRK